MHSACNAIGTSSRFLQQLHCHWSRIMRHNASKMHLPRENSKRPCESDSYVLLRKLHKTHIHTEAITPATINALCSTCILETYTNSEATKCSLPQLSAIGSSPQTVANVCELLRMAVNAKATSRERVSAQRLTRAFHKICFAFGNNTRCEEFWLCLSASVSDVQLTICCAQAGQ